MTKAQREQIERIANRIRRLHGEMHMIDEMRVVADVERQLREPIKPQSAKT